MGMEATMVIHLIYSFKVYLKVKFNWHENFFSRSLFSQQRVVLQKTSVKCISFFEHVRFAQLIKPPLFHEEKP